MAAKILLRIASVLMLVHLVGHSLGQNGWKNSPDATMKEVARWMTGPKFPFMGVTRSMGDYFDGYGYNASVSMVIFIVLLWLASNFVAAADGFLKGSLLTLGITLSGISVIEFIYFFPFAGTITLIAALLVFVSWYLLIARAG